MIEQNQSVRSLVMSFAPPASCFLGQTALDLDQIKLTVRGRRWYCEESPLIIPADILREPSTNYFVGLTFPIGRTDSLKSRAAQMVRGLDERAVRIADYADPDTRNAYSSEVGHNVAHLEFVWHKCPQYLCELAQLDFGMWEFGYPIPRPLLFDTSDHWTVPYGLIIPDLLDILCTWGLRFPETLSLPPLDPPGREGDNEQGTSQGGTGT